MRGGFWRCRLVDIGGDWHLLLLLLLLCIIIISSVHIYTSISIPGRSILGTESLLYKVPTP